MSAKKSGLGKGLNALLFDNSIESESAVVIVRTTEIEPNKEQPRKIFDDEKLCELSDSIKAHGVLQPIIVRPNVAGDGYKIIAGERRYRASRMAGLSEVPVIIKEISEQEAMEIALIENLQRENLNVVEEALGYKALMEEHSLTQDQVADAVGKSRSEITNTLRLLKLPKKVLDYLGEGKLSKGHARTILALKTEEEILAAAEKVIKENLSVRETERLVDSKEKTDNKTAKQGGTIKLDKTAVLATELEISLSRELGRKVKITQKGENGTLSLDYYGEEDLKHLAALLAK